MFSLYSERTRRTVGLQKYLTTSRNTASIVVMFKIFDMFKIVEYTAWQDRGGGRRDPPAADPTPLSTQLMKGCKNHE